jgi:hypothetical protein
LKRYASILVFYFITRILTLYEVRRGAQKARQVAGIVERQLTEGLGAEAASGRAVFRFMV